MTIIDDVRVSAHTAADFPISLIHHFISFQTYKKKAHVLIPLLPVALSLIFFFFIILQGTN